MGHAASSSSIDDTPVWISTLPESESQNESPEAASPLSPAAIFNVEGLVAVITGGGTGIGLMMARALEHNGATVYIIGRRPHVLAKAAKEESKYGRIHALVGDVTDNEALLAIVERVKMRHGYIDLLVNNAGISRNLYPHPLPSPATPSSVQDTSGASKNQSSGPPSPPASPGAHTASTVPSIKAFQNTLWECGSPQDFADVFATNVTAPYYTTVAFLDLLHQGNLRRQRLAHPSGLRPSQAHMAHLPHQTSQVLTVSSSGSFRIDAKVLSPSYTLSKIAATHLGKLLANLLSPWGIRSNVLAPGVWPTEMTTNPMPGFKLDPTVLASTVPLKRTGNEEDMAGTILYLASPAAAYVNGAIWLVDGGRVGTVASTY